MLTTDRLVLRPLAASDLDALVALDADPAVMRHITGGTPTPRVAYEALLLPRMLAAGRDGLPGFLAAEREGRFAGWFHLRPDSVEPAWAEVGYRLARVHWGQGLATEGTRALIALAERLRPGGVVSGRTVPENAGSRRVLEKCGLRFAGAFEFPARELPGGLSFPATPGVLYRTGRTED